MALEQTSTAQATAGETVMDGPSAADESHAHGSVAGGDASATLVICLSPSYTDPGPEQLAAFVPLVREAAAQYAGGGPVLVGYPVTRGEVPAEEHDGVLFQPFVESAASRFAVVQTAAAWLNAFEFVRAHNAACCLLLGAEATSLEPAALGGLIDAVLSSGADLGVPRYDLPSNQGLLNAAVLSPLSRALYGVDVRFPLPLDCACSARMAERMAGAAQRLTTAGQADGVVWPVSEAAVAGYRVAEVETGGRDIPHITDDLQEILNRVAASAFLDAEAKAAFWQRTRPAQAVLRDGTLRVDSLGTAASSDEIEGLIEGYRNGYSNLHELWSLVLPPNTLVTLKRLASMPAESFRLADNTWARIVYDFTLAHRLRTIARNHLMGAFAPLYLAWVASHLAQGGGNAHAERVAEAFEVDKPYLVSRWRWPDRFNP